MLTLHVRGGTGSSAYNPTVYEVGPGKTFDPALAPLTGSVTSATNNTLTASAVDFTGTTGRYVQITSGRGVGQVRQIQAVQGVGNHQIRVSQNWSFNQTPNATSTFAIVRARGIQDAINASVDIAPLPPTTGETDDPTLVNLSSAQRLIVVYPNRAGATGFNPRGAYMENLIVPAPMTIQGVGPGGQGPGGYVYGSVVDGSSFQVKNGGAYQTSWYALAQLVADSAQNPTQISDGEVIYVLTRAGLFGQGNNPARAGIDGLAIEGGDQMSFPGTLSQNGGGPVPRRIRTLGQPVRQGGGIYVDGHARRLQIKNNAFRSDGGSYGGAIRLGSPYLGQDGNASNDNANIRIANNQIIASGGTNLAGGIGIFNGADNYEIARNEICGNFSAEYGGGISHFGSLEWRPHPPQPHLLQRLVRRGRRHHDRRPAAGAEELPEPARRGRPDARLRRRHDRRQRHPVQPLERRRRRRPAPDGRRRPDPDHQQPDRQQHLDPRRRRDRDRRRDRRDRGRQHGDEEHHHRHRHDVRRHAGPGRALHRGELAVADRAAGQRHVPGTAERLHREPY